MCLRGDAQFSCAFEAAPKAPNFDLRRRRVRCFGETTVESVHSRRCHVHTFTDSDVFGNCKAPGDQETSEPESKAPESMRRIRHKDP